MADGWRNCTLGDVIELKRGYDLPSSDRRSGPVPIVSSSGISGWHDEAKVRAPGVVTGRYGTIGHVFFVDQDFWPLNTTLYVRDFKGNDERFISYFLRSLNFQGFSDKSSVPGLNRNDLHQHEVVVPKDANDQRAIAGVLGALDDKIENNRRTAELLQQLAHSIFRAWFVNFEPVQAKAEGARSFPSMPQDVFDSLPATLVGSELGPVPDGWNVANLEEVTERIAMGPFGSDIKRENFVEDGVPVIRGGNLADGFLDRDFVFLTAEKADQLRSANALPGDVVVTHRGTLGQVGMIPTDARYERYVVSQSQMLVRPRPEDLPGYLLYHFLRSREGQHALLANRSQTGVPAISRPVTSLKAMQIVVPEETVAAALDRRLAALGAAQVGLALESDCLGRVRDYLLPQLLDGRVTANRGRG